MYNVLAVVTDFSTEITDAQATINSVLGIVAATAVFFLGLRFYKWVAKK